MRLLLCVSLTALSFGAAVPAMAEGELTCWYNEAGQGTGADTGTHGGTVGQVVHDRPAQNPPSSGDWYWAYVLPAGQWTDGTSCPPALDMSGYQQAATLQEREPLSCWYNYLGQSGGADSGNPYNAPLGQVTSTGENGAWVYMIAPGEWTNGNSCPESLDVGATAPEPVDPATATTGPDHNLAPTFGSIELIAGRRPDRVNVDLQAGGTIASDQANPDCFAGWIAAAPDYRLNYSGGGPPLWFQVTSEADTTLAVRDPQGNWHCNDDTNGLNPFLALSSPQAGQYDVWVGLYGEAGDYPAALLTINQN